jgi:hypothetical protein
MGGGVSKQDLDSANADRDKLKVTMRNSIRLASPTQRLLQRP